MYGVTDPGALPSSESLVLYPPAPLARWTPFRMSPSRSLPLQWEDIVNFRHHITLSRDTSVGEHNEKLTRAGDGPGGIEEGRWYELRSGEHISSALLPFLCDVMPALLPEAVHPLPHSKFPTVTMSVEFKAPIPNGSRTVGVFAAGRFVENPLCRHEIYAEVWTAPANITDKDVELPDNWREGQRCLATAHQMALVVQARDKRTDRREGGENAKL